MAVRQYEYEVGRQGERGCVVQSGPESRKINLFWSTYYTSCFPVIDYCLKVLLLGPQPVIFGQDILFFRLGDSIVKCIIIKHY